MQPIVLAILDGWGYSTHRGGNPIFEAKKPTIDFITAHFPMTLLQASGTAVGLKWGEFGNSEVGHLTIGAGRVIQQYSTRIDNSIKDHSFFSNPAIADIFFNAQKFGGRIHLAGLLTSGTVHAEFSHILALVDLAKRFPSCEIFLHLFADGKDSGMQECKTLLEKLEEILSGQQSHIQIATIVGRDYAMDRDTKWELTEVAYRLIAEGKGEEVKSIGDALKLQYIAGVHDTRIPAWKAADAHFEGLRPNDGIFFFNFREDSMRQIYRSFADPQFDAFQRNLPEHISIASMTAYLPAMSFPAAFPRPSVPLHLAETISLAGRRQLHIAETLKYAHVTYFLNCLATDPYQGEDDILIPSISDIVAEPGMRAMAITDRIIEALQRETYELIIVNFANADMLAHTGNYEATRSGVEAIDIAVAKLMHTVLEQNGILAITADHGNAESLVDRYTSDPESRHDDSPVPFFLIGNQYKDRGTVTASPPPKEIAGILSDVAPTILELMGIPKPPEMTGVSLLPALLGRGT